MYVMRGHVEVEGLLNASERALVLADGMLITLNITELVNL